MNIKRTLLYKSFTTDDAKANAWLHKRLLFLWILTIPLALFTDLKHSIEFLIFVSLLTIVEEEWIAYQQAKSEVTLEKTIEEVKHDIEKDKASWRS